MYMALSCLRLWIGIVYQNKRREFRPTLDFYSFFWVVFFFLFFPFFSGMLMTTTLWSL